MAQRALYELKRIVAHGPPYPRGLLVSLRDDERAGARRLYEACLRRKRRADAETARIDAMARFDAEAAQNGRLRIAGVDEAGRGPLAGPIVAAAVVLGGRVAGLNDSKQLTAAEREALYEKLRDGSHVLGVGIIDACEIDRIGIQAANHAAMIKAAAAVQPPPELLLVDGYGIRGCPVPQVPVVKGDCRSLSIAAASIVAKVVRDRIMIELDRAYPQYGFAAHKGYCAPDHLKALERHGPCAIHRRSFSPVAQTAETPWLFDAPTDNEQEVFWP